MDVYCTQGKNVKHRTSKGAHRRTRTLYNKGFRAPEPAGEVKASKVTLSAPKHGTDSMVTLTPSARHPRDIY